MGQFTFFATLLGALAIAFAVSALWQRSRALAIVLALAIPLIAAALYHWKGEPAALDPANVTAPRTIEQAVTQLEKRVAAHPDQFPDMVMLARSYMAVEKFDRARDTYARALELNPDETDITVEYAESMLRASADRKFPPRAVALLESALQKHPENQRALFFLGLHLRQIGKPAEAAAMWERLLPLLAPDTVAAIRGQIAEARNAAGLPPLAAPADSPALDVEVRLDPTLARLAKPGAVLFVFARSVDGSGPPLAVKRIPLEKLPIQLQLSDADSPMPAARLSSQKQVLLGARLSMSGDAAPASGDIEADPAQVEIGSDTPTVLILNRPVP